MNILCPICTKNDKATATKQYLKVKTIKLADKVQAAHT